MLFLFGYILGFIVGIVVCYNTISNKLKKDNIITK